MSFYPANVRERCESPRRSGVVEGENASGKDANFQCGSFLRFSVRIDPVSKRVAAVGFQTNGCGYMIAAADVLAGAVADKPLGELHGLAHGDLWTIVDDALGGAGQNRQQCAECGIRALRAAFSDFRASQIDEFRGEKALICTCFGVTEETIEQLIQAGSHKSVDAVTSACNAGGGCGSCRMLIQEMLDSSEFQL